jgi:predicted nuclease with TOPRIM domain
MGAKTETQTQAEVENNGRKKLRELQSENRKLKQELGHVKEKLEACTKEAEGFSRRIELLEMLVYDLLSAHYQGKLRVNFEALDLCLDDRCITFNRYEDFIAGLRAAILILK